MQVDTSNMAASLECGDSGAALVVSGLLERSSKTVLVNPRFPNRYKIGRDYQSYARAVALQRLRRFQCNLLLLIGFYLHILHLILSPFVSFRQSFFIQKINDLIWSEFFVPL